MAAVEPAELLDPAVRGALHRLPSWVTSVRVGLVEFDLRVPFDVAAWEVLLAACEEVSRSPDAPCAARSQVHVPAKDTPPMTTPSRKAVRSA